MVTKSARFRPNPPGRRGPLRWLVRLAALAVLAVVATYVVAAVRVWQVAREDHRGRADAIVVLGAAQFDGRPSRIFEARLRHAQALFDQDVAPRIVTVGGGRPGDRFTEAEAGARFLRGRGVPPDAVEVVAEGGNTVESLQAASRRLDDLESVVLVTDPWHSLRSRRIASDLGFAATTSPARSGPVVRSRTTEARYILREAGAYLYYRLFGGRSTGGEVPAAA